jgi:ketosteroid isomerase-like protein
MHGGARRADHPCFASKETVMQTSAKTIIDLERKFWQSLVDQDTDAALDMLCEPALLVSAQGAMKFDHDGYRRMAEDSGYAVQSYELSNMEVIFPSDDTAVVTYRAKQRVSPNGDGRSAELEMNDSTTWVKTRDGWKCAVHTESPTAQQASN